MTRPRAIAATVMGACCLMAGAEAAQEVPSGVRTFCEGLIKSIYADICAIKTDHVALQAFDEQALVDDPPFGLALHYSYGEFVPNPEYTPTSKKPNKIPGPGAVWLDLFCESGEGHRHAVFMPAWAFSQGGLEFELVEGGIESGDPELQRVLREIIERNVRASGTEGRVLH